MLSIYKVSVPKINNHWEELMKVESLYIEAHNRIQAKSIWLKEFEFCDDIKTKEWKKTFLESQNLNIERLTIIRFN